VPFPLHYWGGVFAFWGCEKVAPADPSPKTRQVSQVLAAPETPQDYTPAQVAWLRFVERVERGEIVDPAGQYVAKVTVTSTDAAGHHLSRPKFDATSVSFPRRSIQQPSGGTANATTSGEPGPINICDGCDTGTGPIIPTTTFTTSVGQGGSGYIHDLKIVTGTPQDNSVSAQIALGGAGYTKLDSDLNKGAGGAYIYLCFQRNPPQVLNGLEYTYQYAYSGPNEILTAFQTQYGSFTSTPQGDPYFYNIWVPNQNQNVYWGRMDLNQGASGDYIYSFQSKSPIVPNYTYMQEVGILSGNSSTIQPPAGWNKYGRDLNEGAGGDFIYFCYR